MVLKKSIQDWSLSLSITVSPDNLLMFAIRLLISANNYSLDCSGIFIRTLSSYFPESCFSFQERSGKLSLISLSRLLASITPGSKTFFYLLSNSYPESDMISGGVNSSIGTTSTFPLLISSLFFLTISLKSYIFYLLFFKLPSISYASY